MNSTPYPSADAFAQTEKNAEETMMNAKTLIKSLAICLFVTPAVGWAQDSSTADVDDTISLGEEVQPADGVGTIYVGAEYGDWSLRCVRAAEGPDPCRLYQLLLDGEGNSVSEITLFDITDSETVVAAATIGVPLETLLSRNMQISVDGGIAKSYPYTFCNASGCYARVGFSKDDLDRFKRGSAGQISIVPLAATDRTVDVVISLKGFTAGFDALVAQNASE